MLQTYKHFLSVSPISKAGKLYVVKHLGKVNANTKISWTKRQLFFKIEYAI